MTQQDFFERTLATLEALRIPHMVTGSVGAMLYGRPRLTHDLDVVVLLAPDQAGPLARAFASDEFYFPPVEAVLRDIAHRSQFNILHTPSGSKADLILKKDTPYAETAFARRRRVAFSPRLDTVSSTLEDLILSKLLFFREGGSEKHLRDIRGMLEISGAGLDRAYLLLWVARIDLATEWKRAQEATGD